MCWYEWLALTCTRRQTSNKPDCSHQKTTRKSPPFRLSMSNKRLSTSFVPTSDPAATPLLALAGCTRRELTLALALPDTEAQSSTSSKCSEGVLTREGALGFKSYIGRLPFALLEVRDGMSYSESSSRRYLAHCSIAYLNERDSPLVPVCDFVELDRLDELGLCLADGRVGPHAAQTNQTA